MENKLITQQESQELLTAVQAMTCTQEKSAEQLSIAVDQLAKLLLVMQSHLRAMENTLKARVTISGAQAQALSEAVKGRARRLCEDNGFPYAKAGRTIREAIWRDLRAEYTVSDYHDLPEAFYRVAIDFVNEWSSYAIIRRLRARQKA